MDHWTKWLLGATAVAVIGYVGLVYGGCARDPQCHFRTCYAGRQICGIVYDR